MTRNVKRTKQKTPAPHPLMNRSYNPEVASAFLNGQIQQKLRRHLTAELPRIGERHREEAVKRIAIAAWRYTEARKRNFPSARTHRDNLVSIRECAEHLEEILKNPDAETYRRLYQQLGQRHADEYYQRDNGTFEPIEEEVNEYNDGKQAYEQLEAMLALLIAAADKVIARLPSLRRRPDKVAPRLETSFGHAIADVWCQLSGKPFVGAMEVAGKSGIRANQGSAKLLDIVLQSVAPHLSDKQIARLIKKVAKERYDEAEDPATGRRDKSGRGARSHYH